MFFFQAEDGIRDLVRSRGLGDVYKRQRYVWLVVIVTAAFGAVGWVDDYRKVVEKDSRGLPARWKYFWQSVAGLGAAVYLYATASAPSETALIVPFFKNVSLSPVSYTHLTLPTSDLV